MEFGHQRHNKNINKIKKRKMKVDLASLDPAKKKFMSQSWLEGRTDETGKFSVGCMCCAEVCWVE